MRRYPLIDVDMGIGRHFFYEDPFRRAPRTYDGPPRRRFIPATCHPERQHEGHGMCKPCYHRWWRNGQQLGLNTAQKMRDRATSES